MNRPDWVKKWFAQLHGASEFRVERMALDSSREWVHVGGDIRHRSGRFFRIVGIRWEDGEGKTVLQPMIEQREIGTLGYLLRTREGRREAFVQAKIEPGNVGVVQMAPTYQATLSNASQVHGGEVPPLTGLFSPGGAKILRETLQSEHGVRFLGKLNRNILATATLPVPPVTTHQWIDTDELLEFLTLDYLVNTDARSVLVCGEWEKLVNRRPFTRHRTLFGAELADSADAPGREHRVEALCSQLVARRKGITSPQVVALDALPDWQGTAEGLAPRSGAPFWVRQIRVVAHGREVPEWDQPIVDSAGEGYVELACGRREGLLHFLW